MVNGLTFWLIIWGAMNFLPKEFPVHDLKFPNQIEEELKSGKLSNAQAAYYYTYIGETEKNLSLYDIPLDWGLGSWTPTDSIQYLSYRPVEAIPYLKKRLAKERIVIISEAHHKPQHRVFCQRLLPVLKELGFQHLGIETLTPSFSKQHFLLDTALQERGHPMHSPYTGFYTREPQMGNLVRTAIDHGYHLFAYERTKKDKERDLQQAENIQRYLEANPKGKVVVYCGWYHAVESDFPKRKTQNYMAYHLKKLTGIDPFTIYQDALSERRKGPASPYFSHVSADSPSILINCKGEIFAGFDSKKHVDLFLYHPPTYLVEQRPNWLWDRSSNQKVVIPASKCPDPNQDFILEAFKQDEPLNAVPIDRQYWEKGTARVTLALPKGDYQMRWLSVNGMDHLHSLTVE